MTSTSLGHLTDALVTSITGSFLCQVSVKGIKSFRPGLNYRGIRLRGPPDGLVDLVIVL